MEKNDMMFDAAVLAAGDFPTHPIAASLLDHPHVVCCDGAAKSLLESGRQPWRCVGDGDSLPDALKAQLNFIHVADQETNDLTKAVHLVRAELGHATRIAIIGATGGREDHTLGNIALLAEYRQMGLDVVMYTDHGLFLPCYGRRTFAQKDFPLLTGTLVGRRLSIFNLTCTRLVAQGLRYPTYTFRRLWQGTLNEVTSEPFTLDADGEYILYVAY